MKEKSGNKLLTKNVSNTKKIIVALSAAFGGLSPNLLSLGMDFINGKNLPNFTYFIGILIFAGMGAVVALIWRETDLKKAFYLGIGLPALIQVSAKSFSEKPPTVGYQYEQINLYNKRQLSFSLTPSAFAQTKDASPMKAELYREVIIIFNKDILDRTSEPQRSYEVWFSSKDRKQNTKREFLLSELKNKPSIRELGKNEKYIRLDVPDSAYWIFLQSNEIKSVEETLSNNLGTLTIFRLGVEKNIWSGLLYSIGFKTSTYKVYLEKIGERKADPIGKILNLKGNAKVNNTIARTNMDLYIWDVIKTDTESYVGAEIGVSPNKIIKFTLKPNSEIEIGNVISITFGQIEIKKSNQQMKIITNIESSITTKD
ncbi:MAG: hypothetical protein AAB116_12175 [Candidatus Poribacteria bacterium]